MEIFYYVYLFILWTLFWSFSSVIISRIKNHKSWIITWRSECPKCKHKLWILDLFPIFSYLSTWGKCRYCHKKISVLYPILEISLGLIFIITSYFLVDYNLIFTWNYIEIYKLFFLSLFSFLSFIYVIYDILYLEIPDSILAILIWTTFITIWLQSFIPWFEILKTLPWHISNISNFDLSIITISFLASIGIFYVIMIKWLSEIMDFILYSLVILIACIIKYYFKIDLELTSIWSAFIASIAVFGFFFLQVILSWWRALWGWDLRIAILMWMIAWINFAFPSVMISYLVWSIFWIFFIIISKIKNYKEARKKISNKIRKILGIDPKIAPINTQIPFGPFLAIWITWVMLFYPYISKLIESYL